MFLEFAPYFKIYTQVRNCPAVCPFLRACACVFVYVSAMFLWMSRLNRTLPTLQYVANYEMSAPILSELNQKKEVGAAWARCR